MLPTKFYFRFLRFISSASSLVQYEQCRFLQFVVLFLSLQLLIIFILRVRNQSKFAKFNKKNL